jgi:hypothetical protein
MGTVWIKDFQGGLDVRRLPETSAGGTLMRARDVHITRGKELEQRADFVPVYTLPAALTKSMAVVPGGLVVFGHQTAPGGLPAGVSYQQLQHPSGEALVRVPFWTRYRSKLQVIGEFADGSRYLFYDGARVTDVNAPPNAVGSGRPAVLLTAVEKMFVGSGENLFFSAIGDSTDYGAGAGVGDGVIVMSTHAQGSEELTGLARYDEYVAVFGRRVIQTWFIDPDPALSKQAQVLEETGCIAPRSVTQFGDGDVFYLDRSGIRSLRARDSSNSAATSDIGSPIDPLVIGQIDTLGETEAASAIGLIEPRDGRFWTIIDDTIYVFSYFASARVSAWTEYKPGFSITDAAVWEDRVWLRSGDTIYVYGNLPDQTFQYSDDVGEAWMPYLDADQPARAKHLMGIDMSVRGTWDIALATDPNDTDAEDRAATVSETTFGIDRLTANGIGNHISVRFRAKRPESATLPAKLGSVLLHFERDDQEDS